jgi:hypothetical protein
MDSQDQYIILSKDHGDSNQAILLNASKPLNRLWITFDLRCGCGHVELAKLLS